MSAWLRAFALIALLVASPFIIEGLFGRNSQMALPDFRISDSFWHDLFSYSGFVVVVALLAGFILILLFYMPQTYDIADWLTLAERDMNANLRGWGGGLSADARKKIVEERANWLSMVPASTPEVYKMFFELNQKDLESGGGPAPAGAKARFTAFLLRELYEGNVRNAQLKIFNDVRSGGKPYIAPGIWQIVGYDDFDEKKGFPPGAGVGWFPLLLTVKLNRFPRDIIMVKPDKTVVENWAVINELNQQLRPKAT